MLDQSRVEPLVARLRAIDTDNTELARQIEIEADYFERNAARMRYAEFRRRGLFVGSGVIEARLPHGDREPAEDLGHVLERAPRQRHHGLALLPDVGPLR